MRKITASAIKALKVNGKRYTTRDQNIEVRVGANGSVAIDFYFKDKGRTGREKLLRLRTRDSVRAEDIAEANERLAELRHDFTLGITPRSSREKAKAKARAQVVRAAADRKTAPNVRSLCRDYEAIHLPSLKHHTRRNYRQLLNDYVIPSIGGMLVSEVNRGALVAMLDGEPRKATKAALRRVLGGLFTFALDREWIQASPATGLSKVAPDVRPRQRLLSPDEIAGFWSRAGAPQRFLLATGQRVEEVATVGWDEINEDGWVNKDPKYGQQVLIPLSDLALSLLPERGRGKVWGMHENTLTHSVRAISDDMGGERFTAHDLRRTAATHWTRLSGSDVRERLLNHAIPGLQGTYNLYRFEDEKREAVELWAEYLRSVL